MTGSLRGRRVVVHLIRRVGDKLGATVVRRGAVVRDGREMINRCSSLDWDRGQPEPQGGAMRYSNVQGARV
jgi:hypothetical protein